MEYLKCVESWKQAGNVEELAKATAEYETFVQRDPMFEALLSKLLLPIIQGHPGILQSDIVKRTESKDWSELYSYNRPIAKEDIYYALYFAEKFGRIKRTKKGRSYELWAAD